MSRARATGLLLLVAALGGCASAAIDPEAQRSAVRAVWDELGAAFTAEDWAQYQELWVQDPSLRVVHPAQRAWLEGWEAFASEYRGLVAAGSAWEFRTRRLDTFVDETASTAWAIGELELSFQGQRRTAWQMAVLRKVDGRWRVAAAFSAPVGASGDGTEGGGAPEGAPRTDATAARRGPPAAQQAAFQVGDVRLRYEVRGSGDPMVLVPGWTQGLHTWDGQVEELARSFRAIRYDRGPHGLSTDPADLMALLDHLGIDRTVLVGHSVGAAAALRFAVNHPARVDALVLYGPPAAPGLTLAWNGPDSWPALFARLGIADDPFASAATVGVDSILALARQHPLFRIGEDRRDARALLDRVWAEYEGRDLLSPPTGEPATRAATPEDLAKLTMPTLIITGTEEIPYFRLAADALHYAIPGARRVDVPGGGHMVHMIAPGLFTEALLEFLSSPRERRP